MRLFSPTSAYGLFAGSCKYILFFVYFRDRLQPSAFSPKTTISDTGDNMKILKTQQMFNICDERNI